MKRILTFGLVVSMVSPAVAGEVGSLNQFQAGSPALAAEVNENFAAVAAAVNDNAQNITGNTAEITANTEGIAGNTDDITGNADAIASNTADIAGNAAAISVLQTAVPTAGVVVSLDGIPIGRYLGHGSPRIEVASITPAAGTELVAGAVTLATANVILGVSNTGYRFAIWTSSFVDPNFVEGELDTLPVFFDDATCTGSSYFPVEGDTGFFTSFIEGTADSRPAKRWSFRQGLVWGSPDPDDPNPVYMIRRGQTVQTVPLLSILVTNPLGEPACVDVTNIPGFDAGNPLHVNNTAFAVEPADAIETGIADRLGGQITVGLPAGF